MIGMKKIIATICIIQFAVGHLLSAGQYVHQTIGGPVRDVLNMEAPEILGNTELAALGLVDVTAAPFWNYGYSLSCANEQSILRCDIHMGFSSSCCEE